MRLMRSVFAGAFALAVIAACGGPASTSGPSTGIASSDITAYRQLATDTQSAVTTYRATMVGSSATLANCTAIHDQYDAEVRPWISQMVEMAGEMDDWMGNQGGGADDADMRCASATMMDELDYHRSVACTLSSLGADQAEATRHADAMNSYAGHLGQRCGEMLRSADNGTCCNWEPMMNGCQNWSRTCCSTMMRAGCCGGMMGGMMDGGDCCGAGT